MWRVLLLDCTPHPRATRSTTRQHLQALASLPAPSQVLTYNAVHGAPRWLRRLDFDAVVLSTTFLCMRWNAWFESWKRRSDWIADLDALKIAFPQDEYDHSAVLDDWLAELGVSVVCTVLDETHRAELYPKLSSSAAFYEVLTGYIDRRAAERFSRRMTPQRERPHDIVYRARKLPYWFGSHGQLKHQIGDAVLERAPEHALSCDISTRSPETVLGEAWLDFLGTGRATIGTESGSSALDRRGELSAEIRKVLDGEPAASFDDVSRHLQPGWDDYRFFALSPRHLEAVVTKTAQILVEGHYSGVLEPERHYLPLRRDLSNLDEVLDRASDRAVLDEIAERAYEEVYRSGRFDSARLTAVLEGVLAIHAGPQRRPRGALRSQLVRAAEQAAIGESEVERLVIAPAAYVVRTGRAGYKELLAGLRLLASDRECRNLLVRYMRATEIREHVSPRQALTELLLVGSARQAQTGKLDRGEPFRVFGELDRERRAIVLRSRPSGDPGSGSATTTELVDSLRASAWDFAIDHSQVGTTLSYRVTSAYALELPLPAGQRPLAVLSWLARSNPEDVAAALAPMLANGDRAATSAHSA